VARRVVPRPVAPRGRLRLVARAGDHPVPGRPHRSGPRLARRPRRGRAGRRVRHPAGVPENRRNRRAVPGRPGHRYRGRRPRPPGPALRRADDAPGGDCPGLRGRRTRHHLYVRVHRGEHAGRPRHPVARHAAVRRPAAACLGDPAAAAAPPVRRAPARRRPGRGERGGRSGAGGKRRARHHRLRRRRPRRRRPRPADNPSGESRAPRRRRRVGAPAVPRGGRLVALAARTGRRPWNAAARRLSRRHRRRGHLYHRELARCPLPAQPGHGRRPGPAQRDAGAHPPDQRPAGNPGNSAATIHPQPAPGRPAGTARRHLRLRPARRAGHLRPHPHGRARRPPRGRRPERHRQVQPGGPARRDAQPGQRRGSPRWPARGRARAELADPDPPGGLCLRRHPERKSHVPLPRQQNGTRRGRRSHRPHSFHHPSRRLRGGYHPRRAVRRRAAAHRAHPRVPAARAARHPRRGHLPSRPCCGRTGGGSVLALRRHAHRDRAPHLLGAARPADPSPRRRPPAGRRPLVPARELCHVRGPRRAVGQTPLS